MQYSMFREKDVVRALIIFFIFLVLVLLFVLYLVSALNGTLQYPEITISRTYVTDPTRAVAAFLIPLGVFVFVLVIVSRLVRMYPFIYRSVDLWLFAFLILFIFVAIVGVLGASAVPLTVEYSVHITGAIMLFVGVAFGFAIMALLDHRLDILRPKWVKRYRGILATLMVATSLALAISIDLTSAAGGILEIIIILMFLMYIASWLDSSEYPLKSGSLPARVSVVEAERADAPLPSNPS